MTEKIRVGAVSYLNTKPFLYGIEHSPVRSKIDLVLNHPSQIAEQLLKRRIDVGLVPVRLIPLLENAEIISDYGIACDGAVGSVVICSQLPISEVQRTFLDYQSRTSAALAQILLAGHWKVKTRLVQASPGYEKQVMGKYAGLFIGDRALRLKDRYDYCYDLGEAWKEFTGKPFVFAAWIAVKPMALDFKELLNEALLSGLNKIDQVIEEQQPLFPEADVQDYLKNKIQYLLTEDKRQGLEHFLQLVKEREPVFS